MQSNQVPRGPADLKCPLWRKPMSKVCHTCPLWMSVPMEDPITGEVRRDWTCALVWNVTVQLKHAQISNRTFGLVEAARNEVSGSVAATAAETGKLRESIERLVVGVAEAADRQLLGGQEVKQLTAESESAEAGK